MSQLHRHSRDSKLLDMLRILDEFCRTNNWSIDEESSHKALITTISAALTEHGSNPIRLYGFRTEAMFAHVAASLGKCEIIVEENAGIHYDSNPKSIAPDFRILTVDGQQFFVEVKNFHQRKPNEFVRIKQEYLRKVESYANKFNLPLKIAVFWSRWRQWTLIDSSKLIKSKNGYELPFPIALARNEMSNLGDEMIGTAPPLSLRIHADPNRSSKIDGDCKARFYIRNVEILADGCVLKNQIEKQIALFLMRYGTWDDYHQLATFSDENHLDFIDFSVSPREGKTEDCWNMVGSLSGMISNQYLEFTTHEGIVKRLTPVEQPRSLGLIIPPDFRGEVLNLWRFTLIPNYGSFDK